MSIKIEPPFPLFTDASGDPLVAGFVFIGTANLNPETNAKSVYWDEDQTIPAAQPIRTIGGYFSRNGSPGNLYLDGDYSIEVKDSNSVLVYSSLSNIDAPATDPWIDAINYGDGTKTAATINAALTAIGGDVRTLLLRRGTWTIDANVSVPVNVTIWAESGATFNISTGITWTVFGFDTTRNITITQTGTGKIIFSQSGVDIYPEWFGAVADGSTDNTVPFQTTATVLSNATAGKVVFTRGTYKFFNAAITNPVFSLTSIDNITFDFTEGAVFQTDYSWASAESQSFFLLTGCKGVKFLGTLQVTGEIQAFGVKTNRGLFVVNLAGNCESIDIDCIRATGCISAFNVSAAAGAAENLRSRIIRIGTMYVNSCGYGINLQQSGDDFICGMIYTQVCQRSYFIYGVRNQVVNIESRDQEGDDCVIDGFAGYGTESVYVNYTNVKSTNADSNANCISIRAGDQTPMAHRNLNINIRVHYPASGYFSKAVFLAKYNNAGGFDTVDRGHTFEDITITGSVTSDYSSAVPFRWCVDGTWGTGEFFRNIAFRDITMQGVDSSTVVFNSIQDSVIIENLTTNSNFYILGGVATAKVLLVNCQALNFTGATSDTGYAQYYNCNITNGSIQSIINKTFLDSTVGAQKWTDFSETGRNLLLSSSSISGDLTGTNNIFFVKLPAALGARFELTYALTDDSTDTTPGTRGETIGIKVFTGTMNSSGVWASQISATPMVTELTQNTASVITVYLVNGTTAGANIAVSCTNYNASTARGGFSLKMTPMSAGEFCYVKGV